MTRVAVQAGIWLISGCMYLVPVPPPTPVRKLLLDGGDKCSAVVVSPTKAYTAGHCLRGGMSIDGLPVTGTKTGPDLAMLKGQFRGPYASAGSLVGQKLLTEGYGCNPRGETRSAVLEGYRPGVVTWGGLEIMFRGQVCPGDSGGALWSNGYLVGILTAYATGDHGLGFATPLGQGPIVDLDAFLK